MTECQNCARKTQLWLCSTCIDDLKQMLIGLAIGQELPSGHRAPGWIEYLEDAALGRTRLGESARRSTEVHGPLPFNSRAGELLQSVHNTLSGWVQHLCSSQGISGVVAGVEIACKEPGAAVNGPGGGQT